MTMDIGLIFAIVSAISFAAGIVTTRKGLYHSETALGAVYVSVPIGAVFFTVLLIATENYEVLWHIPRSSIIVLSISGVINFIGGRLLSFTGIKHLGANRNGAIQRTTPLWAVALGVLFLNESLTIPTILGIILIVGGAALASVRNVNEPHTMRVKGLVTSLGGALCYAIASVLIRAVIKEAGSPIIAAFISFWAASVVLAGFLFNEYSKQQLSQLRSQSAIPFAIGGILAAIAQFFRYTALDYTPVSLVEPVISTNVIFILLFSFFINRNIELFSVKVILGIVVAAIGAFIIFL